MMRVIWKAIEANPDSYSLTAILFLTGMLDGLYQLAAAGNSIQQLFVFRRRGATTPILSESPVRAWHARLAAAET
jgi:hypothetical protein